MMDQVTYLALAVGQAKYYRPCYSVFACGGPYATTAAAEPLMKHDLNRARQLVKESGYEGRPVMEIHVTDFPFLSGSLPISGCPVRGKIRGKIYDPRCP
jgi:peptide/nickel transport system substrate-binding protein